jgi:hypothetical protein
MASAPENIEFPAAAFIEAGIKLQHLNQTVNSLFECLCNKEYPGNAWY